jgi:hypothetical protein
MGEEIYLTPQGRPNSKRACHRLSKRSLFHMRANYSGRPGLSRSCLSSFFQLSWSLSRSGATLAKFI